MNWEHSLLIHSFTSIKRRNFGSIVIVNALRSLLVFINYSLFFDGDLDLVERGDLGVVGYLSDTAVGGRIQTVEQEAILGARA